MTIQPTRFHATTELAAHFGQEPPSLLYHYTGQDGLLGIIGSGEIWATSIDTLNDMTEFIFAKKLAINLIKKRIAVETNSVTKKHLGYLLTGARAAGINICVASWSAVPDDLSQWRAYSHGGTGYSIGMEGGTLFALADRKDFLFAECIYKSADQRRVMSALINRALAGIMSLAAHSDTAGRPLISNLEDSDRVGDDFRWMLQIYAPLFKNKSFAAEKEWRIISPPLPVGKMKFRAGRSTIISYNPFSLCRDKERIAIRSVYVGPCPDPDLAVAKTQFLLTKHCATGEGRPTVHKSSVPHRTW